MKCRLRLCAIIVSLSTFLSTAAVAQSPTVSNTLVGKVICGYQAWFQCYGDGSPMQKWFGWANGSYRDSTVRPHAGFLSFDIYPDISDYPPSSLFQTGFQNLGDGRSAKLFSSWTEEVIDKHFSWMQTYGIDGIAFQNFTVGSSDLVYKQNHDSESVRIKRASEKYGRIFYVMYDISSLQASQFDSLKTDWANKQAGVLHLTSSPQYATQNGKPVVAIWGFGFIDRVGTPLQCLDVINWFKSQGCYVVGGVPTYWRTGNNDSKPGFDSVYKSFDMLSPWTVGRFADTLSADNYAQDILVPDLQYCQKNGIDYQPVMFPGFSWSNWNGGSQNQIPRNRGEFLWRQFRNIKQAGIQSMYVAMFDEYNEGTAILKAADSYYEIPTDQYFVTSSADGTYLSSDFYMRLAGKITRVQNNLDPLTAHVTIPYSEGPWYFRTSFEQNYDAQPNWISTPDPSSIPTNVSSASCAPVREEPRLGQYALKVSGTVTSTAEAFYYFKVFDVNIPVLPTSNLTFYTFPKDSLARHISVDLYMADGSNLRDAGATDSTGLSMHPAAGRGQLNTWNKTSCNIGKWINGKTIKRIMVAYDNRSPTGNFTGYVDDISVYAGAADTATTSIMNSSIPAPKDFHLLQNYPNPFNPSTTIRYEVPVASHVSLSVYDVLGRKVTMLVNETKQAGRYEVQWNPSQTNGGKVFGLSSGVYFYVLQAGSFTETKKLILLR